MSRLKATLRFIGSLVWLAGIGYIIYILRVVPLDDGWKTSRDVLYFGDKFNTFMTIGFLGLLQSSAFVRTFFSCVGDGLNTRYDNVYYNSSGQEVGRETDHETTMMGCFMSIIIGFLLMFVTSALAAPFVFCYNLYHFINAWTWNSSHAGVFKFIAILLVCATLAGEFFAGKWLYEQVNTVCQYNKEQKALNAKPYR